jgi:hypothetical protein
MKPTGNKAAPKIGEPDFMATVIAKIAARARIAPAM